MAAVIVALEIGGCGFTAQIAVDALIIDVEFSRYVFGLFIRATHCFISNRFIDTHTSALLSCSCSGMPSFFNMLPRSCFVSFAVAPDKINMFFPISGAHISPIYLVIVVFVIGILGGFFGVGGSFIAGPALRLVG